MIIGKLYKVKKWFWLLFPTKETVVHGAVQHATDTAAAAPAEPSAAAWYSKLFNCEVTYFSPDSLLVCLEEEGKFKKVLTSEGLIGWTWFTKNYNDCFEEVRAE